MSATYNWAYTTGATNKYGITISSSADNVRPANAAYVGLFGNDITGNGSRQYPYRTLQKASTIITSSSNYVIIGAGVYRELMTANANASYIGDGDVTIDVSFFGSFTNGSANASAYNIKFKGKGSDAGAGGAGGNCFDCTYDGLQPAGSNNLQAYVKNVIIINQGLNNIFFGQAQTSPPFSIDSCTFYNNQSVIFSSNNSNYPNGCIFYKCNISSTSVSWMAKAQYCIFYQCNFKITNGVDTTIPKVLYPSVPAGFTYYSDITSLRNAMVAYDSTIINPLPGCSITDPLFNNLAIGDFTLPFNSPAKNASYFGTPVGATSIAYNLQANATESLGGFDFSSNVNLNIANNSITIVDTTQTASIETKVIPNLIGREIAKLDTFGFNADRNGQYIDSIIDLSGATMSPSQALNVPFPYLVLSGAIVYNGNTYQPGDRFTTSGATGFTTSAGGVVQEIIEAPQRHTVMARFSNGYGNVTTGSSVSPNYWYYVNSGSVTYSGVTYTASTVFKTHDFGTFSGSGVVTLAMLSGDTYQHYEIGTKPYSNNSGNTRTGVILRGNGDPAYVRGGINVTEFPINSTFIQLKYIFQVANLTP